MVRIAEAEAAEPTPEETLLQRVRTFVRLKTTIKSLTTDADEIKKDLSSIVDADGDEDEDGSRWLNLPAEVDGFKSLKRERRVTRKIDIEAAETLLREKGLYDRCVEQRPVLNEDEVMACFAQDLLSDEDFDMIFPSTVTYAFVPSKKGF